MTVVKVNIVHFCRCTVVKPVQDTKYRRPLSESVERKCSCKFFSTGVLRATGHSKHLCLVYAGHMLASASIRSGLRSAPSQCLRVRCELGVIQHNYCPKRFHYMEALTVYLIYSQCMEYSDGVERLDLFIVKSSPKVILSPCLGSWDNSDSHSTVSFTPVAGAVSDWTTAVSFSCLWSEFKDLMFRISQRRKNKNEKKIYIKIRIKGDSSRLPLRAALTVYFRI